MAVFLSPPSCSRSRANGGSQASSPQANDRGRGAMEGTPPAPAPPSALGPPSAVSGWTSTATPVHYPQQHLHQTILHALCPKQSCMPSALGGHTLM